MQRGTAFSKDKEARGLALHQQSIGKLGAGCHIGKKKSATRPSEGSHDDVELQESQIQEESVFTGGAIFTNLHLVVTKMTGSKEGD